MKRFTRFCFLLLLFISLGVQLPAAQVRNDVEPQILTMRERAEVMDRWTENRLDTLVPELMRRENIDMWVLVAREYNEDPVLLTMLPATWQSSRRTTILLFYDTGEGETVERIAVARYDIGFFKTEWDPEEEPGQWERFAQVVAERNPERIAVNRSDDFALADGISHTDFRNLSESLSPELRERIVSAENLAIGWLETRTPEEMTVYPQINRIAHHIVAQGLSDRVITPGITTTDDVEWWYREKIRELNLTTWFHPSVSVQRMEQSRHSGDFSSRSGDTVILPGDLIHVDFGIQYLGLSTDTQRNAYVLRPGESDAPDDLKEALATGNRLQDILTSEFVAGRTGNEILGAALEKAESEGINATIYTHPIGYQGHGAGPTIGLWDQQGGVPGKGDYPLYPNTAHSIELNAEVYVESWDKPVRIMLEEDILFDGEIVRYTDGRMKEFYLIPRQTP